MPDPSDREGARIARATERTALRGAFRAFGYLVLVAGGLWLAVTLLATTLAYLTPAPGNGIALEGWILLATALVAIAAGSYVIFRTIRDALD